MSNLPGKINVVKEGITDVKVKNGTTGDSSTSYVWTTPLNPNAITTGFYILAGLSSVILVYFIFRAIR